MSLNSKKDKIFAEEEPWLEDIPAVVDGETSMVQGYNRIFQSLFNRIKNIRSIFLNRKILTGNGLNGGGNLSTDRELSVTAKDSSIVVESNGISVNKTDLLNISNSEVLASSKAVKSVNDKLESHNIRRDNPHRVTKEQIGLGNVNNWGATSSVTDESNIKFATASAVKKAFDEAVMARQNKFGSFIDITIEGDKNTYYPVQIYGGGHYGFHEYSISRGYSWKAPHDWNTSTHKGGLTLTFRWSGDIRWGGNHRAYRVIEFHESYSTMVAGMSLSVDGMIVWLRGGGTLYRLHLPSGIKNIVKVNYNDLVTRDGWIYSPRKDTSRVVNEIFHRWPIRNNGEVFVNNKRVTGRFLL